MYAEQSAALARDELKLELKDRIMLKAKTSNFFTPLSVVSGVEFCNHFSKYIYLPCIQLVSVKVNNPGYVPVQWQRQMERELCSSADALG